ncbi:Ig-like domain-containing domain [Hymenobacter edaphi]|nr:Ig-like domain-containing domain [Hymenobacter edaphi]
MFVRVSPALFLLPAGLCLAGCAAISQPEGGARDTEAPKLVSSNPKNGATNVKEQNIRLEFSESVQLKDLSKNLLITPTISEKNPYKLREERRAIELRFEKPLEPNTTYVFNFRGAVVDITESNPASDVVLAFSTGAALDSGRVRGSVTQLLNGQPEAEAVIALYPAADTADIFRNPPYYQTRADKGGQFELRNVREGSYRIYALVDKNNNSRYEEPERVAYLPQPIELRPRLDTLRLVSVRPDSRRPLILSQQTGPDQFRIGFNEGLQQFTLAALGQPPAPALAETASLLERGRTLNILRAPAVPAGRYLLTAIDSAGNRGVDTVNVRFEGQTPATSRRGAQYQVVGNPRDVYRQGQLKLQFLAPVRVATDKPFGRLVEDSVTRRPLRLPADGTLSPDRTLLTVNLNTRARTGIVFVPDTTAILAIGGQPLRLRPVRLRVTDQASTGTISGTINTKYRGFELQLLDQNYQIVRTVAGGPRTFRFDNVDPGTYRLRVLIDADNDGRWRGGDPKLRVPAEPVYLLPQTQQVRANWEIENLVLTF